MLNKKSFILDTSTLLYNASSLRAFGSKNVVVPYPVLEELDRFKDREGEIGKNARQVVRELNELRKSGNLSEGVQVTPKGGILTVILTKGDVLAKSLNMKLADDRILNICLQVQAVMSEDIDTILVTKDINLAVKAEALGLIAQDFTSDKLIESADDLYKGCMAAEGPAALIDRLYAGEQVTTEELATATSCESIEPNQYITLTANDSLGKAILLRGNEGHEAVKVINKDRASWGVSPRNKEQRFAFDALMDPDIPLVTLVGLAGSGKSLLALACALEQVQDMQLYDRLVVSRPVQPMGKDIGFLPGTLQEKMDPWMGPVKDAINFLTRKRKDGEDAYEHMIETGMLEVEALTYIRGRSIPNTLFLLDEAQDLTRAEIKTIISRMCENSKLIITGDVMQISNPYLDATNTGLASVVERFKSHKVAAHVTLEKGERSALATLASEIL